MKTILVIISILFILPVFGQESSFDQGNKAYANGDYARALVEYNKIIGSEKKSAELYYNLGNTYYKLGELGEAIWAYENSLKIDPTNENTAFNLKFVNNLTDDELDTTDSGIVNWLKINLFGFSINFWAYVSLILCFILAISLYFFFTTQKQKVKNMALTVNFGSLFLVVTTIILASLNKANIIERTEAIIIIESVEIKSSPSDTAPTNFNLYEGTKVDLLRSNEGWTEIGVNNNTGWVKRESIWDI